MCLLIESIKLVDGKLLNLSYHKDRIKKSRKSILGLSDILDLSKTIELAKYCNKGVYKSRILYGQLIDEISFEPYYTKLINSLQIVHDNDIIYDFKYQDRSEINNLYQQKSNADDILIVRNGYLTDTSYCNIALYDGKHWFTPTFPLLKGTKRQELIDKKIIFEKDLKLESLIKHQKITLFNSMIDPFQIILNIKNQIYY